MNFSLNGITHYKMLAICAVVMLAGVMTIDASMVVKAVPNIDYQIHSNNDLREMNQLLLKGARRFKFDPHYISSKSACGGQGSCLLLNHDTPIPSLGSYNSSNELLSYLRSNEFNALRNGDYVSVALCFKSAPDKCKNTTSFSDWLRLADDFFEQAKSLPAGIELILDGDAKPKDCLEGRWQPLNSVWIQGDSVANAFYENGSEHDEYRYQILNNKENITNWEWMATPEVNYGKFSNSTYPYQLWEPDKQEDYHEYISIYRSGMSHDTGFNFAINTDMAMFWIYTASDQIDSFDTLPAANQLLDSAGQKGDRSPLVTSIGAQSILAAFVRESGNIVLSTHFIESDYFNVDSSEMYSIPTEYSSWLLSSDSDIVKLEAFSDLSQQQTALLVASNGRALSFHVNSVNGLNSYKDWQQLSLSNQGYQVLDVVSVTSEEILLLSASNANSFVVSNYHLSGVSPNIQLVLTTENTISGTSLVDIASAKVVIVSDVETVLYYSSIKDNAIYATLVVNANVAARWVRVSTGLYFDIASTTVYHGDRTSKAVMLIADHGYCYNSHTHNTRSYPTVCDSAPVVTPYTLDYTFGLIEDWIAMLKESDCGSNQSCFAVTVCHPRLLHGSYDQGSKPSTTLLTLPNNTPLFVGVHEGLSSEVKIDTGCGEPYRRESIVIDAFSPSTWTDNLLKTL